MAAGRRVYRQVRNPDGTFGLVELTNPAPPLSSDLRFDGSFISPVDGTVIRSKHELNDHNKRNGTLQILPGMDQDLKVVENDRYDKSFGKQAKADRLRDVIRAVEVGE